MQYTAWTKTSSDIRRNSAIRIPVDGDVQTVVRYMRMAMEARGFNAHQIDFATNNDPR